MNESWISDLHGQVTFTDLQANGRTGLENRFTYQRLPWRWREYSGFSQK